MIFNGYMITFFYIGDHCHFSTTFLFNPLPHSYNESISNAIDSVYNALMENGSNKGQSCSIVVLS
jgi:hypothetical protein